MFQLAHLVKVSVSVNAWLGMVEPHWKRFGAVEIVPEWVEMIKTELIGMEYGWVMAFVFQGNAMRMEEKGLIVRNT